jgi:chromosome segregation ATPase
MSREVVSKEAVRTAREQLLNKGVSPTQRNVHAITGGSMTRVNQFMRELDEESQGLGVRIQERLATFVMALHAELQQQAQEAVDKGSADSQKLVDAAKEDLKIVQQASATLQTNLANALKKAEDQSIEYAKTVGLLNKANEELSAQAVRLQSMEREKNLFQWRVAALEESLTRSQDAFTAYQQFVACDREKTTNAFESALEGLKTELRDAHSRVTTSNLAHQKATTQNHSLNRDVERLTGEVGGLSKRIHELEEKLLTQRAN